MKGPACVNISVNSTVKAREWYGNENWCSFHAAHCHSLVLVYVPDVDVDDELDDSDRSTSDGGEGSDVEDP